MGVIARPLFDRVVVKPEEFVAVTEGGIVLPETAKEVPVKGTVVVTGPGKRKEDGTFLEMQVKEGDEVMFAQYVGHGVKLGETDYLVLKEEDILLVLEED